jgi:glycosyltransferase involved in cell wall biosynthesis
VTEDRKSLGWSVGRTYNYDKVVAPDDRLIDDLANAAQHETFHVFCGTRWVPTIVKGLAAVRRSGARFAIMAEPRVREGWKGEIRYFHSWLTEGWLRRNASFVLAIGRNGPPWFSSVGYAPDRIFPFAYFVDTPECAVEGGNGRRHGARPLRIGYLGRLVAMKGVFDLVAAVALLGEPCNLEIGGGGPDEARLRASCDAAKLDTRFHGVIPIAEVGRFLSNLDVLVLASTTTDDGWGVVVSEALMCGTAVVATDCVGASMVLDDPKRGRVVPARSPHEIADAIMDIAGCGGFDSTARSNRAAWSKQVLGATGGAQYLLDIVAWSEGTSPRPTAFHHADTRPVA